MPKLDHVEFLKNSDVWPNWPACPVKNKSIAENDFPFVCGLVFAKVPTVYKLNLFKPWTEEEFEAAHKWEYTSFEEMVSAGWEVD